MLNLTYKNSELVDIQEDYRQRFEIGTIVEVYLCTNYSISGYIKEINEKTLVLKDLKANSTNTIAFDRIRKIEIKIFESSFETKIA